MSCSFTLARSMKESINKKGLLNEKNLNFFFFRKIFIVYEILLWRYCTIGGCFLVLLRFRTSQMIFVRAHRVFHIITATIPFCYVRMYGRFADTEFSGGFPNGILAFRNIFSETDRALPCVSFQKDSSFSGDVGLYIWKKIKFMLCHDNRVLE